MSFFAKQHTAGQYDLEKFFDKKIKDITKEEILSIIPRISFESAEVHSELRFVVNTKYKYGRDIKWWHRVNKIWLTPIYVVLIGPINWIIAGEFGVEATSNVGRVILKLIGKE